MPQTDQTRPGERSVEGRWNSSQRNAIQAEADQILADPSFKKSRRCVVLFRRLIEHSLDGGDGSGIKERTLGIEVFGREADYDTNTDPIVRMTANEIRKRLAQYYQSSSSHDDVRISLVPGGYLLRFDFGTLVDSTVVPTTRLPEQAPAAIDSTAEGAVLATRKLSIRHEGLRPVHRRLRWMAAILIAVSVLAGIAFTGTDWLRSNQYLLWAPLLKSSDPVIICVADATPSQLSQSSDTMATEMAESIAGRATPIVGADNSDMPWIPYVDAEASARFAGWFKEHGKPFRLVRASRTSLEDLRHGPVVLVGAFDNTWNLALFSKLRFHVQIDPATKDEWIEDLQNPTNRAWKGSGKLIYSDSSVDYAVITRVFNKDTGTWFVAAGGLGMHATEAACDLLTDPGLSHALPKVVRSGDRNVQVVLKTTVIGGHSGMPEIVAIQTW